LKLLQERIGKTLEHIGIGNNFLNRIQVAQQLRERIDKWYFMKLKSFCIVLHEAKKLLHSEGNNNQTEDAVNSGRKSLPVIHLT
jgi:hypothetical protein